MKQFKNIPKRLIALIVSALMLISMIPVSTLIAFATGSKYVTIALVDGTTKITNANVSITYTIGDDSTSYSNFIEYSTGIYQLVDTSIALETAGEDNTIVVSYTVTANDYESFNGTANVDVGNPEITVQMKKALSDANLKVGNALSTIYLKNYGANKFKLNASTDSSSAIEYESSNPSVAEVLTTGKVEILDAGETTITVSVASDGTYKADKFEFTLTVKEDTTAPTPPSVSFSVTPGEYVVSNDTITVTLKSTDKETGIYKYYYKLVNSDDFVEVSGESFTMDPEYRGKVLVKAVDNAGNESNIVDADGKIVILDSLEPVIESEYTFKTNKSVTSDSDNKVFTNEDITVNFTIIDTNVDVSGKPVVNVNGADIELSAWDQADGKGSFLLSDEGEYTYSIAYTDIAGNSNTVASDTTLVIDKTAPVINAVDGNATKWTNDDVTLKVNASDAGCGGVEYSLNGGTYTSDSEFTVIENGEYSFKVKDALGNESEATVVNVDKIDKDKPEIKDFGADESSWTYKKVTITGTVEDATSGVEKLYYQKNGDTSWTELDFNSDFTLEVDEECNTTYKFYCEDAAGNKSTESSVDVKIDKTKPVNAINTISSGWKNKSFAITGEVTDEASGLSKVYYRLTGATDWAEATVTGTSFNFNTSLTASGTYTYDVYSVDNAGNESVISVTDAILFDNVKPVVTLNALDPEGWTNKKTTVSGTVSDDLSDIKKIYYVRAGGTPIELQNNGGTFSFDIPNDANNTDSYVVYCVDNAGNISVNSELAAKIDIVKPGKPTITYSTPAIQKVLQTLTFGIYKAEQVATIESTDDLSGVKEIEYTLGSATVKTTAVEGKITVPIPVGTNAKLTAIAYDNAGNDSEQQDISKDSANYEFKGIAVDDDKPEITDVSAESAEWTNQKVVISGTVADDNVGVEKVYIKKGVEGQDEEVTDFDGTNFSYEVSAQDYNGDYILYCEDYAGNISDESSITVKMDITNPKVLSIVANPDVWTNGDVVIGGRVSDNLSGVKKVYYRQGQGETKIATLTENTYEFVITAQDYNGNFYVWCEDNAGNKSDEKFVVVNMDNTKPVVGSGVAVSADWTNDKVVISGNVSDDTVNGASSGVVTVTYTGTDGSEKNATLNADGFYEFTLPRTNYVGNIDIFCVDKAGNKSDAYSVAVKMDIDAPAVETGTAVSADWTKEDVKISGVVSDTSSGVRTVYYSDTEGSEKTATLDGNNYTFTLEKTNYEGNIVIYCVDNAGNLSVNKTVSVKMDIDAPSAPIITYDRNALAYVAEVLTFGFYQAPVTATITTTDNLSLDTIEYEYAGTKAQYDSTAVSVTGKLAVEGGDLYSDKIIITIPAEFKGTLKARAWDKAGNASDWTDEASDGKETITGLVIDTIAPNADKNINDYVEYSPEKILNRNTMDEVDSFVYGDNVILYYREEALVTINIDEANFYSDDVVVSVVKNGAEHDVDVAWNNIEGNKFVGTFTLSGDGDYSFTITYKDRSTNEMIPYTSPEIRIDDTAPVIQSVVYAPADANANDKYFNTDRKATITVKEHNFLADDVVAAVTAKDVTNNSIANEKQVADHFKNYLSDRENWYYLTAEGALTRYVALAADPDIHVAEVTFTADAQYTFALDCNDIIGNEAEQYNAPAFVIDHEKPDNLAISYSEPIVPLWKYIKYIISVVTFGAYNPEKEVPLIVTVSADDVTSGVDYFEWKYTKETGASDINAAELNGTIETDKITYSEDGLSATATFEIPAQARGYISFRAIDRAGNGKEDADWVHDDKRINIVDTIAPTRVVEYAPAQQVVDAKTLETKSSYTEGDNVIAYYNTDNTVTITVTEANFYSDDVVVVVTKNGSNYPVSVNWIDNSADVHVGTFTLAAPEDHSGDGDYIVNIKYKDRSTNEMKDYTSHLIVIDTIHPEIAVDYAASTEVVLKDTEGNDREYFNDVRKATITVKEHNFRADDVVISVKAKNVLGNNVDVAAFTFDNDGNVKEYLAQGAARSEWTAYDVDSVRRADDTYELTIVYAEDANYTFDIRYTDLAANEVNYGSDYFTVDKTKPECVEVKYSETVDGKTIIEKILNTITFGAIYYNEQMEVTITAKDDISGINHFVYSYEINDDVSKVNAELLNQTIAEALENSPIVRDKNSSNFSATFNIPKEALTAVNQFNGTVHFTAYDRSANESEQFSGESTIVVDNIKPTSTVTFNEPVQRVDNVSYYDGEINATIVINEANFFSEDVKVVVTKDKVNFPVKVDWKDNSVDVHTGTFTLAAPENHSGDGDYIVNVTYVDRSTNEMIPFVSNQLTIDTKEPVIGVSDVKHQSANNKETISFTVSVTDTNIARESFKPVLNAVIKKDNGDNSFIYETIAIALGDATEEKANGETVYTYSVKNLEVDGFYSLVCSAVDYANHRVSAINTAADQGGNTTVETMNFSVNREGSVFWIETEHNDKYTGETFADRLNGAYANDNVTVRLHEVNVDKVDENADKKTVFTINDGNASEDIELKENDNYSKNVIVGTGGWYETVYALDNDNFKHDGVYSINVITYDKADNSNVNTKTEAGTISFTLDRTNPVISANIKNNQSINDTQFWVEFEITETNLDAETTEVKLTDNDGKPVETEVEDLGNNEYKFLVKSGYNYSVEIVAKDLAGNTSELCKVEHFTISTNIFILWYANTLLFWGSIGGTVLLAGAITSVIFFKKRKMNIA